MTSHPVTEYDYVILFFTALGALHAVNSLLSLAVRAVAKSLEELAEDYQTLRLSIRRFWKKIRDKTQFDP